jgi:hypothetical protein
VRGALKRSRLSFALLVCAAAAALSIALHLRGGGGAFLGDDFSHVNAIYRASQRGELWTWTLSLFHEPLGNASYAYRPLGFVSYALDWTLFGDRATAWRFTSLLVLVANGLVAGLLVREWLPQAASRSVAAAIAASCTLCFPFVGEVSYWLNGRFDLLACLFSLLFLATLPRSGPSSSARHALRLVCLAAGLASKESALLLPLAGTLIVLARTLDEGNDLRTSVRDGVRETAASWIVLLLYLGMRASVLGSAWKVYTRTRAPRDLAEWWDRLASMPYIVREGVGPAYVAWLAAVGIALAVLVASSRGSRAWPRFTILALLGLAVLYAVAPSFSFDISSPHGEGSRHLYPPWAYASIAIGLLCTTRAATAVPALAIVLLALAAQGRNLEQWQAAGRTMHRVLNAVAAFAPTVPPDRYALLLLPERIGPVWFANNAQGGIVMKPYQRGDYLDRMAITTSDDLPQWTGHLHDGTIARLKGAERFDPRDLLGLYCWVPATDDIVRVTPGDFALNAAHWRDVAEANARAAGCLQPF